MNLGSMQGFVPQTASENGAQGNPYFTDKAALHSLKEAYKNSIQVAPIDYTLPAINDFMPAKDFGNSQGGLGAVHAFG